MEGQLTAEMNNDESENNTILAESRELDDSTLFLTEEFPAAIETTETDYTTILTEIREINSNMQYLQGYQLGLNAFTIALLFTLILAVIWGRH